MKCYVIPSPKGIDSLTPGRAARPDAGSAPGAGAGARHLAQLPRPADHRGQYSRAAPKPDLIPLSDGAGEVVAVGPGVSRVKVGDRVAGCFMQKWIGGAIDEAAQASAMGGAIDGMLTELAVLEEDGVVRLPAGLSFEEGATLPCAGVTAWHALVEIGNIKAGDIVLVQGSGGVSIFALQFAKMFGARVIATSSSAAKAERLKKMGAEAVIDYRATPDWDKEAMRLTGGRGADITVEVGGAGTLPRSFLATRLGGRIAVIGLLTGMAPGRSDADPAPEPARAGPLCRQQADVRGDEPRHRGRRPQAGHRQGVSIRPGEGSLPAPEEPEPFRQDRDRARSRRSSWKICGPTATPRQRSPSTPPRASARTGAARLHDAPAGRRAAAGAAWRRQHLGEDHAWPTSPAQTIDVLCVKGSGWDMGTIEAPGLPAVRLAPLRELRGLQALSDEDMVNVQRSNLLDTKAPNPSVETLLHAFLPHKFIDHTHSNAVLALTDQPDGEALARRVYGKRAALVPYVMPGFALAKKGSEVAQGQSRRRGADPAEARHLLDGRHGGRSLCAA